MIYFKQWPPKCVKKNIFNRKPNPQFRIKNLPCLCVATCSARNNERRREGGGGSMVASCTFSWYFKLYLNICKNLGDSFSLNDLLWWRKNNIVFFFLISSNLQTEIRETRMFKHLLSLFKNCGVLDTEKRNVSVGGYNIILCLKENAYFQHWTFTF